MDLTDKEILFLKKLLSEENSRLSIIMDATDYLCPVVQEFETIKTILKKLENQ